MCARTSTNKSVQRRNPKLRAYRGIREMPASRIPYNPTGSRSRLYLTKRRYSRKEGWCVLAVHNKPALIKHAPVRRVIVASPWPYAEPLNYERSPEGSSGQPGAVINERRARVSSRQIGPSRLTGAQLLVHDDADVSRPLLCTR